MALNMDEFQRLKTVIETFAPVPESEWEHFRESLSRKQLKKGEPFFSLDEEKLYLGFVSKGLLHSYYRPADGKIYSKTFVWENRMAGAWTAIIQKKNAHFECTALEDTELLVIEASKFLELCQRNICWVHVVKAYTEKLLIEREIREYNSLMLDSLGQYNEFRKNFKQVFDRIPQYLVASYIGISEVSLSRMLKNQKN